MRIDRVDLMHVRVPLVEPFRISTASVDVKDGILSRVWEADSCGIGESSPMAGSFYSDETPESCLAVLRSTLVPGLLGTELSGPRDYSRLAGALPGNHFAKAGLEMALWDLEARRKGVPLYSLLGGRGGPVPSGLAVGIYDTIPELLRAIERFLEDGYVRVKIKIKPGWDVKPVSEVRRVFGDIPLFVDANAAYTLSDSSVFRALDDFGLIMFEQPFPGDALDDLAVLQAMVKTPICLDESADTLEAVKRAVEIGAGRIINIKLQRVGGFGPAVEIHDYCRSKGVPVWCGYMPELGVSAAGGLHMATLPGYAYPADLEPSLRWFTDDITKPLIEMDSHGRIEVPDSPGLGFDLDMAKVLKYQVYSETFTA
ncbi:MAG: o-succinylbenzoate synthase [Firmicutes bacterium]|nr:o-succinylbenzoate synthase [Bacillota bacterium]